MRASYLLWGFVLAASVAGASGITLTGPTGAAVTPTNSPNIAQATTGPMSLFVDSTGSDNNDCTDAGTFACATPQGAINKVPLVVRHAVTVAVANGTYPSLRIYGFHFVDAGSLAVTANVVAATGLTTGQADGGLTAVSNTAVPAPTISDTNNAWTTDNLKGLFVRITSGAASGQRRIIVANTATALTLARHFATAPSAADGYTIETGGVTLNAASAPFVLSGNTGSANLSGSFAATITGFNVTAGSIGLQGFGNTVNLSLNAIRATTGGQSWTNNTATLSLVNVFSSGSAGFTRSSVATAASGNVMCTGSSAGAAIATIAGSSFNGSAVIENTSSTGKALSLSSAQNVQVTLTSGISGGSNWQLRCASGSTGSVGIDVLQPFSFMTFQNLNISDCVNAVNVAVDSSISVYNAGISNATNGLRALKGGSIQLLGGTCPTFTTVTNETNVDGTAAACATSAVTGCILGAVSGAKVCE